MKGRCGKLTLGIGKEAAGAFHHWIDHGEHGNQAGPHYGHAGPTFLTQLYALANTSQGVESLRSRYSCYRQTLDSQLGLAFQGRSGALATVAVAEQLVLMWLLGVSMDDAIAQAAEDALAVGRTIAHEEGERIPVCEHALQALRDHRDSNRDQWVDLSRAPHALEGRERGRLVGVMTEEEANEGEVWLLRGPANKLLDDAGFPHRRVWSDLRRNGILIAGDGNNLPAYRKRGTFRNRVYVLKRSAFEVDS